MSLRMCGTICHSSTRFFVEETFSRWKNRFRFLLRELHLQHKTATLLIYVSMVLHNLCTIRRDDAVDFEDGTGAEWAEFFQKFGQMRCPSCARKNVLHCPHVAKWASGGSKPQDGSTTLLKREHIKAALWAERCSYNDTAVEELAMVEERARARAEPSD